jgi:Tfp pilus assembly protein PilO
MNKLFGRLGAFDVRNMIIDKKKALFIIIFCLAVIYFDFSLLMRVQIKTLKGLGVKIAKINSDLHGLNRDLSNMREVKNKQARMPDASFARAKRIISEEEVVSLLQDISDMAKKNNVQIIQMKPHNEPSTAQEKTPANKFTSVLITLDLTSDYHSLGGFINDLENAQAFISVQELKITSQQKEGIKEKANLELKTYVRTSAAK